MSKNLLVTIFGIALVAALATSFYLSYFSGKSAEKPKTIQNVAVSNYDECVAANYTVSMTAYPQECITPTGKKYIEDIGNAVDKEKFIRLQTPLPNQKISSPLTMQGQAAGVWFSAGVLQVQVLDSNNKIVGQGEVKANGDTKVQGLVPFSGTVNFDKPATSKGSLVVVKANPSGTSADADQLKIPVKF